LSENAPTRHPRHAAGFPPPSFASRRPTAPPAPHPPFGHPLPARGERERRAPIRRSWNAPEVAYSPSRRFLLPAPPFPSPRKRGEGGRRPDEGPGCGKTDLGCCCLPNARSCAQAPMRPARRPRWANETCMARFGDGVATSASTAPLAPHPPFGHPLPARGERERQAPIQRSWNAPGVAYSPPLRFLLPACGEKVAEVRMRGRDAARPTADAVTRRMRGAARKRRCDPRITRTGQTCMASFGDGVATSASTAPFAPHPPFGHPLPARGERESRRRSGVRGTLPKSLSPRRRRFLLPACGEREQRTPIRRSWKVAEVPYFPHGPFLLPAGGEKAAEGRMRGRDATTGRDAVRAGMR